MDTAPIDPELVALLAAGAVGYVGGGFFGLLLHECGHALAALLVGLEPRAIVVGRGPILLRHRFGRTWLVIRALPAYGIASRLGDPDGRCGVQAIVVAAGPAASLLLCAGGLLGWTHGLATHSFIFAEASVGVAVTNGGLLIGSLWPRTFAAKGRLGLHATDGWKLLRLARGEDVDKFRLRYARLLRTELDEADAATPPSALAPELVYQVTRADRTEAWARADMADVLVGLLCKPELSEAERLFIVRRYKLEELELAAE